MGSDSDRATRISLGVLAVACTGLVLVYAGVLPRRSPLLARWLGYLDPATLPLGRLLDGGLWLACLVALCGATRRATPDAPRVRALHIAAITLFAGTMFYVLRDTRIALGDGPALVRDPVHAVVSGGYYTFVEELAGMWLPLRIARIRHLAGTPPVSAIVDGYRIVSIGFGMLYAAVVVYYARRQAAPRRFALALFGHAALLMFTGYVENYVGAFALLAVGFLVAADALARDALSPPATLRVTLLCALAVLFHGVAVWSVFGLVALAFMTTPTRPGALGRARIIASNGALGVAVLGFGLALFYYYLTPGVTPVHVTPLVHGGSQLPIATSIGELGSVRPASDHALAVLRVGFPALTALLAVALALPRQTCALWLARDVRFALVWLLGFAVHQLLWRSTLGTFRDWDLFGFTAIPLAYLAARALALLPHARAIDALLLAVATLAGLSWPLAQTGVALTAEDRVPMVWEP